MLTRMLRVMMSKTYGTGFFKVSIVKPWSVECRVWSVEWKLWSVKSWEHQNDHFVRDFRNFHSWKTCEKDRFCSSPQRHGEATGKPETRDETTWEHQNDHLVRDFLQFWHFVASKSMFFLRLFSGKPEKFAIPKSMFSCEASADHFQHISQNATPTTESAPCRHLTQALPMRFAKKHATRHF